MTSSLAICHIVIYLIEVIFLNDFQFIENFLFSMRTKKKVNEWGGTTSDSILGERRLGDGTMVSPEGCMSLMKGRVL